MLALSITISAANFGAAKAQEVSNNCHAVKVDIERLACYDEQTEYQAPEKKEVSEVAAPTGQQWRKSEERSSLDGRTDAWLSVESKNSQPNQIGTPERARLWVRCMNNSTNFFITFNDYTPDNQNVRYKLDDNSIKKVWMVHMQGGEGIGIWSGGSAIPFIKKMFDAEDLVVAYKSYSNLNLEFTFDISGLRARIDPLAKSCQWKP
ncbi:type VI secretion system-associated protein TagO [Microbulbifer sp. S227A]|uniref:type VI secretion system-associated protein TagO n=1 Tax=Microbulbifer sp. S227A TaxID=3415131 RepID=UPI003C7C97B4